LIDREDYFLWCGVYIEPNLLREGLVSKPEDRRWSSYRFYAFGEIDPLMDGLIHLEPYYLELGNNSQECQKKYQENVEG